MRALVRDHLETALLLGRHAPGLVDAWLGDPAELSRVGQLPLPPAAELGQRAAALRADLPGAGLPPARRDWLAGQLRGLETTARRLAGEPQTLLEQAAGYDLAPEPAAPATYDEAHARLADLLPGGGPLAGRLEEHRRATAVPPARLLPVATAVVRALRAAAATVHGLPAGERLQLLVVRGAAWSGFTARTGRLASEVRLDETVPLPAAVLVRVLAHETYPGHHLHRCLVEEALPERPEAAVALTATPDSVVAEGVGELALACSGLAGEWPKVLGRLFPGVDLPHAAAVDAACRPLAAAAQDAALLLAGGAGEGEALDHLQRRGLLSDDRAARTLRFLAGWGAYAFTYTEGARLLSAWLAARPADQSLTAAFRRLLVEPVTPAVLRADLAGQGAAHAC